VSALCKATTPCRTVFRSWRSLLRSGPFSAAGGVKYGWLSSRGAASGDRDSRRMSLSASSAIAATCGREIARQLCVALESAGRLCLLQRPTSDVTPVRPISLSTPNWKGCSLGSLQGVFTRARVGSNRPSFLLEVEAERIRTLL